MLRSSPTRPFRLSVLGTALALLLVWPSVAFAQEDPEARRRSTQQRLERLEEEIQRTRNRLKQTEKEEQATQERLEELQREIALREELVSTYQTRLDQLEAEREQLRDTLETLGQRLESLRANYRDRMTHAYKYGRLHDLALLLASRSINQMLIRARYLQRFAADRRQQRQAVTKARADLRASREELAQRRQETRQLLVNARNERKHLRALERDRREVIDELQARRSELKEQIEQKQQQARQLEAQIQKLASSTGETSSPEAFANLSAEFKENRGALPWPVDGAITQRFGNQTDANGISIFRPGITIATLPQSEVRAVYRGTVAGINFVPGYGTYVVIRHGEYLSVYSNFSSLRISEGETVETGQIIGQAGTEAEPRGAALFFAVFERSSGDSVDPLHWLSAR